MDVRAMFGDDPTPSDDAALVEGADGPLPLGTAPVGVSFALRRVRLLQLRGVDGREQSFRHTVSRWRAEHPELSPFELPWSAFLTRVAQTPPQPPAGFVFNVARCGSTLLANMLSAPPGCLTLKESSTVGVLLREMMLAEDAAERAEIEALLSVTIQRYAGIGMPRTGAPSSGAAAVEQSPRLFVKPHSLSLDAGGALLRLFPTTPAVFLYRKPAEVVASMLAHPPYGDLYAQPHDARIATFPMLAAVPEGLTPAAFYAHLWCAPVSAALQLPTARVLLLDYSELVERPRTAIERLTRHLGMALDDAAVEVMLAASAVYAKDASGRAVFDAGGRHRRPPLSAAQHAEVALVTGDLHSQLTARRRAQDAAALSASRGSPGPEPVSP